MENEPRRYGYASGDVRKRILRAWDDWRGTHEGWEPMETLMDELHESITQEDSRVTGTVLLEQVKRAIANRDYDPELHDFLKRVKASAPPSKIRDA